LDINPLFKLAATSSRKPHFVAAIFLCFFFIIIGQLIGELVSYFIPNDLENNSIWGTAFNEFKEMALFFLPIIFVIAIRVKFYEKRTFASLGFTNTDVIKKITSGFGFGALMFSFAIALLYVFDYLNFENNTKNLQGIEMLFPALLLLVGYVIQGSTEEIVFRGWLLPTLGVSLKPWLAILISSLLFALLHGANDNITLFAIVNLILFGVFISLFALREGSIWGVCAWHAIWNWLQGNFYGLEVSGRKESIALLNLQETGPDWVTGGKFGPEGGFIVTIILLLGIVILIKRQPNILKS
jgi:membrane protease YdiL (CAAX protease family)